MGTSAILAHCEACTPCNPAGEWDPTGRPVPPPAFESLFEGLDKNKDGRLDKSEWHEAFQALLEKPGDDSISRARWIEKVGQGHMFDAIDLDRSGAVTSEEWDRAFDVFDINHDGIIESSEWTSAYLKAPKTQIHATAAAAGAGRARGGAGLSTRRSTTTGRSSNGTLPSNRPIMESCVNPCPTRHVLGVMAQEGWDHSRRSEAARALLHAADNGCVDSALRALEAAAVSRGFDWRFASDAAGDTPLHLAAARGHLHVAGLLLKRRALLDSRNIRGQSPLHLACHGSYAELVKLLCDNDADPRLGDLAANEVPGMWAVRRHAERFVQDGGLEASAGGAPWSKRTGGHGSADVLDRRVVCIEACLEAMQRWDPSSSAAASLVNSKGITALHVAAEASDLCICRLLVAFDARVDAADDLEAATPLMYALRRGTPAAVTEFLLDSRADLACRDKHGGSALHYAAAAGDGALQSVEMLLAARANVDATDERGATPLALSGLRGAPALVRFLLAAGADPRSCRELLHKMPAGELTSDSRTCRDILEGVTIGSLGPVARKW